MSNINEKNSQNDVLYEEIERLLAWHFGDIMANAGVLLKDDDLTRSTQSENSSLSAEIESMSTYLMDKVYTEFYDSAKEIFHTMRDIDDLKSKLETITTLKELRDFDKQVSDIIFAEVKAKKQELETHIEEYLYEVLKEFESAILAEHESSFEDFYDNENKLTDHKNFFLNRLDTKIVQGIFEAFKESFGITDWEIIFFKQKTKKLQTKKPRNLTKEELAEYYFLMQGNYLSSDVTVTLEETLDPLSEQTLVTIAASALEDVSAAQINEQITREDLLAAFTKAAANAILPDVQNPVQDQVNISSDGPQIPAEHVQKLTEQLAQLDPKYIENAIVEVAQKIDQQHERSNHYVEQLVHEHSGHITEIITHGLQDGIHDKIHSETHSELHAGLHEGLQHASQEHDSIKELVHKVEGGIHEIGTGITHGVHHLKEEAVKLENFVAKEIHKVEHGIETAGHKVGHEFHKIKKALAEHVPHHASHTNHTPHAETKKAHGITQ